MQLRPFAHFFSFCHHFWVGLLLLCFLDLPKSDDKKWATGQSCIREEEASYKILTLTINTKKKVELIYCKYFSAAVIIFILDYENKHN